MCSESLPKEFEKTAEVLPFTTYGLSSMQDFKHAENEIQHLELLKKAGLTYDEIKIYQDNKAGLLDQQKKVESNAMKEKLDAIYNKMKKFTNENKSPENDDEKPSTSNSKDPKILNQKQQNSLLFYPEGHPMNNIKEMEEDLFGHLRAEDILPISKRRKMLRRFERKKERILAQERQINIRAVPTTSRSPQPGSLWDMKEPPNRNAAEVQEQNQNSTNNDSQRNHHIGPIGPRNRQLYSIRDNNIVRLERVYREDQNGGDEYRAADIILPENPAEEQLLEGTKMSIDNIMKIDRFKDYDPGVPSKILYLKNIAPNVTQEQVSLLFNQFVLANGGPIDVRLMTSGRMRGQAFVEFQDEDLCIQALEETNGTILSGQPVIAQFARNTNHRRPDDNR